ncbi:MAG: ChaN family lipoprotein [Sulfurospirillaceae bacterium]|nr:ChaN family lipoprotein [Sulfurospirillaceae bacterium]
MFQKIFIASLFLLSFLKAECFYTVDIDAFPKEHTLKIKAQIYDPSRSVLVDVSSLASPQRELLEQKMFDGSNKLEFSYTIKDETHIREDFISLTYPWLPMTPSLCKYTLRVKTPKDFVVIAEAESIQEHINAQAKTTELKLEKPIDRPSLIASNKFETKQLKRDELTLKTYFFKEHTHLADAYLEKTKSFIEGYEKILGKFPFSSFSIVENLFQTGYSMPTFTLIGDKIIDKSYLIERSLGHEILHQWFGNSLFVDEKGGNWTEGLTTFLSDYHFENAKNEGLRYRKEAISKYLLNTRKDSERSLDNFYYGADKASKTLGYDKGMFFWYMLSREMGEERFLAYLSKFYAINRFSKVSYEDFRDFFQLQTNSSLVLFFDEWVYKKGVLSFDITQPSVQWTGDSYEISFDVIQDINASRIFTLPLHVKSEKDENIFDVLINKQTKSIKLNTSQRPISLDIDPKTKLFRNFFEDEKLHTLEALQQSDHLLVVSDKTIKSLPFENYKQVATDELSFKELKNSDVVFLNDSLSDFNRFIMPFKPLEEASWQLNVFANPWNKARSVAYVKSGLDALDARLKHRLKYYGAYSALAFNDTTTILKQKPDIKGVWSIELAKKQSVVEVPKSFDFDSLIAKISGKRVIFVGEMHTNYAHHINQLEVVKHIHAKNQNLVIALEMFQKDFQPFLDDYVAKKIDLVEMLKGTEYFKRWSYEPYMYMPIFEYARENGIKLLAMNQQQEITKKTTKQALMGLSKKERENLPEALDFTNDVYKERLSDFFKNAHKTNDSNVTVDTDYMYQSQVLWDETMAYNIAKTLQEDPLRQVVVLVGAGHLQSFHGIPDRLKRRVDVPIAVILQDVEASEKIADFILYTSPIEGKKSKKLGIYLDKSSLKIDKIIQNERADKMGIKKGDIIVSCNGFWTKELTDLKLALFASDIRNEKIRVDVKRGEKILTLEEK